MAIRSHDLLAVGAIAGGALFGHTIVDSLMTHRDSSSRMHRVERVETASEVERTIVVQRLNRLRPVVVPETRAVVKFAPLPDVPTGTITPPTFEFELRPNLDKLEGVGAVLFDDKDGASRVKIIVKKDRKSPEGGNE